MPTEKPLATILKMDFDWYGVNRYGGANQRPAVPALPSSDARIVEASRLVSAMQSQMQPAARNEVSSTLLRLRAHFPSKNMDEALAASVANDYVRILLDEGYSLSTIEKATAEWLKGEKPFFPTVGELCKICKKIHLNRQFQIRKLQTLIQSSRQGDKFNAGGGENEKDEA